VLIAPKKAIEDGSSGPHQWYALGVLLLLLLPISPLAFYLMTFLGDAWVTIAFIWISALTILISRRSVWDGKAIVCAITAALLVGFCTTVKHNVVAILPLFCLLLYVAVPSKPAMRAAVAAIAVAVFLVTTMTLPRAYRVRHAYAENAIMALDLVGMCVDSSAICEKLPYTNQHLNKDVYRRVYNFGNINQLIFVPPLVADDAYLNITHDDAILGPAPELRAEFYSAIRRFPVAFARVKIKGFLPLLSFDSWMWLPAGIKANPYGLHPNGWTGFADALTRMELKGHANRVLRWPFAGHLPWILVCVGMLIYFGMRKQWVLALVLLVMTGYYLSYLAATPSHDFRYMYPASLVVQVMAVSLAARGWLGAKQKRTVPVNLHDRN
jgi:hypothetical protein